MKAKELAEILLKNPEMEVCLFNSEELFMGYYGIKDVELKTPNSYFDSYLEYDKDNNSKEINDTPFIVLS